MRRDIQITIEFDRGRENFSRVEIEYRGELMRRSTILEQKLASYISCGINDIRELEHRHKDNG